MGNENTIHSVFSPSSAHRWVHCPGSVEAEAAHEDTGSEYAAEGTAAHRLAEECLTCGDRAATHQGRIIRVIKDQEVADQFYADDLPEAIFEDDERIAHYNDVQCYVFQVTPEMAEYVQVYLDYCCSFQGDVQIVEHRVDLSRYLPAENQGGTLDFGNADLEAGVLDVVDLKYGKGHRVHAEDNEQGMLYALGMVAKWEHLTDFVTARFHVVQPRLDHIDTWEVSVEYLHRFAQEARDAALLAQQPKAPRIPGHKQCQWCKAKGDCKPLAEFLLREVSEQFEDLTSPIEARDVATLSDAELSNLLHLRDLVAGWFNALEDRAVARFMAGEALDGWKLVEGRSNRKWTNEELAEKTLRGQKYKVADIFTRKLISPSQAEKLTGKKLYREKLAGLVDKPRGKPTLVPASDNRPALNPAELLGFDDLSQE